jgi:3-deoxy-D-manno-octulosonic-acid transferase
VIRLASWALNLLYALLLVAAAPWLAWQMIAQGKQRSGFAAKFFGQVPLRSSSQRCIWLHAVSVGEVNLLAPLIAELEQRFPKVECVISTTTATGYEVALRQYAPRMVFYCPLDFSWAVRRALARIRPDVLVLAELELWPNLMLLSHVAGAAVVVVNGRVSDKSFRGYLRARRVVAPLLSRVDRIAAQSDQYAQRFIALGAQATRVTSTGSIKFDGARFDRSNPATRRMAEVAGLAADDVVFLAGSTGEPEEALAIAAFQQLRPRHPQLRLIIVPRHPERFDMVARMLSDSGIAFARRSELDAASATALCDALLVDTVGELGAWWGTADIAYVGGSLNRRGGQNMIEPAAYGAAVCFGPNTRNFRDIVALLLNAEAAVVVRDGEELTQFVERCLTDVEYRRNLAQRGQLLVREQQGATARTVDLLAEIIEPDDAKHRHAPHLHQSTGQRASTLG